ncbi:MAG: hypothetical protein P4L22_00715, partial [Candidatus Babeliales bacterium]|nr:hypothetical protein [Candidatus Babeliales bacterium]
DLNEKLHLLEELRKQNDQKRKELYKKILEPYEDLIKLAKNQDIHALNILKNYLEKNSDPEYNIIKTFLGNNDLNLEQINNLLKSIKITAAKPNAAAASASSSQENSLNIIPYNEPNPKSFRLPSLTPDDQAAGVNSGFYPDLQWTTLHKSGNIIEGDFLLNIFFNSMFLFYIKKFSGYDYRPNKGNSLFASTYGPLILKAFKENELLKKLAIAYMRQKIVIEKLQNLLPNIDAKIIYKYDRFVTDLQIMIFYWIKEGYEEFAKRFKLANTQEEKLKSPEFLAHFVPEFTNTPYYNYLLTNFDEFKKPRTIVEGMKL